MKDRVMQLTNPWIEAGKREGRHEGEAELVLKLLARRLGALSAAQEKSIRKLPLTKIEELGEALLEFTSRADFVRWLRLNN
jgi:plasmid maintenance system killer protein